MKAKSLRMHSESEDPKAGGPFLETCLERIGAGVETGGPQPEEYQALDSLIEGIYRFGSLGVFGPREMAAVRDSFGQVLHYRDAEELRRLAEACGIAPERILIEQEPLGINLFLHIIRP